MLKYIETTDDNSGIVHIISAADEHTMLTKLRGHLLRYEEYAVPLRAAKNLEELGAAVDYTYGFGENDIKIGHLIEELPDGTFKPIW